MPKRFKWRKPKPMKDQPSATHKDNERQEKPSDTHTVVTGGIKVDLVDDLREQHKTEYDKADTHNKKQLRWTKITAGLFFIYASSLSGKRVLARNFPRRHKNNSR